MFYRPPAFVLIYLLAGLPLPLALAAQPVQSLASIKDAAVNFISQNQPVSEEQLSITAGRLDSRLRLAKCDAPLKAFLPPGARRDRISTVGVRCSGVKPWTLYVPVTIAYVKKVVVAANVLYKGQTIAADDVNLVKRKFNPAYSRPLDRLGDAVGKTVKRTIAAGQPVYANRVSEPVAIRRGDLVDIVIELDGLEIRANGEALDGGAIGKAIRVKNLNSNRVISGVVSDDGKVIVKH